MCNNVTSIIIETEEEKSILNKFITNDDCFENFEIKFKKSGFNKTNNGFLRNQNIITQNSNKIKCSSDNGKELIINNKIKLTKFSNMIKTSNYTSSVTKLKTRNKNLKNLFNHHSYLTNGTDLIEDLDEYLEINNGQDTFDINKKSNDFSDGTKIEFLTKTEGYFDGIIIFFKNTFSTGFHVIILLIVMFVSYYVLKMIIRCAPSICNCFCLPFRICLKKKQNNEQDIF